MTGQGCRGTVRQGGTADAIWQHFRVGNAMLRRARAGKVGVSRRGNRSVVRRPPAFSTGLCVTALLCLVVTALPHASAHATPAETAPRHGEVLPDSPQNITVRMTQRFDPDVASMRLLDAALDEVAADGLLVSDGNIRMTLPLDEALPAGGYIVKWQVLSTVDGHTTQGSWAFAVGEGVVPEVSNAVTSPSFRWDAIVGKAVLYAGIALAVGTIVFVWGPLQRRGEALPHFHGLLAIAGAATAVGMGLFALSQVGASGLPAGDYFATTFGKSVLWRAGLAIAFAAATLAAWRMAWPEARSAAAAGILLVALVGMHALFGHPAEFLPTTLGAGIDALHILVVAAWVGGLVPLVLYLRTMAAIEPAERLQRTARSFSRLAAIAIAVATLTGVVMSYVLVGLDRAAWTGTPYGQALAVKIALVLPVMALLGGANRYFYVRTMDGDGPILGRFRRNVWREVAVAGTVFLAAGAVTNLTPPAGEQTAEVFDPPPPTLFRELPAEILIYHVYIDPGPEVGSSSRFELHAIDPETFQFVPGGHSMTLYLDHEAFDQESVRTTPMEEAGKFEVEGAFFAAPGAWNVTITYRHPDFGEETVWTVVEPET